MQSNRDSGKKWEVVHEIVRHLGKGWQVKSASLQDAGAFVGHASGPSRMELFFIAQANRTFAVEHI